MNNIKFRKSLKFKMTVWYSAILLLFSFFFVLVTNIFLTKYMNESRPFRPLFVHEPNPIMQEITEKEMGLIRSSRLEDLENIRLISIYSIIPLTLLSFLGGYLIAYKMLKPLEQLDKEMSNKNADNLDTPIPFNDNGDEISSLFSQFNNLSFRVSKSFKSQREFVENASHEIKTPLTIIQANLEMALDEKDLSKKELNSLLSESKNSISFMNKLTEDLLIFSLIDSEIDMKGINLKLLLNESKNLVIPLTNGSGFKINIVCPKDITIKANKSLLIRAFQNIIENSIKYSKGTKLDINVKEEDKHIYITLKDDGIGISKEHCEEIFNRFYRIDRSRSRKSGGSGLGLAITKEIIERHNGTIECKSDEGNGCEFSICFS
ncbi:MAG: ATP-binding protein [Candidatus Dojkabacteria bacterium]